MTGPGPARRVADAVLYEGYLLYPYRSSSAKNQVRWQFGVMSPAGAAAAALGEAPALSAALLLRPAAGCRIDVHVRFLQVQQRSVEVPAPGGWVPVDRLIAGDTDWIPWFEAVEREVVVGGLELADLLAGRTLPVAVRTTTPRGMGRPTPSSSALAAFLFPATSAPTSEVASVTLARMRRWRLPVPSCTRLWPLRRSAGMPRRRAASTSACVVGPSVAAATSLPSAAAIAGTSPGSSTASPTRTRSCASTAPRG